jgi:predicted nucleic acid-binding protein
MIYLDTSVVLAELFAEDKRPPAALWDESLVSSRLLQYEIWVRVHARGLEKSHAEAVRDLLSRINYLELSPIVLSRALEPFPVQTRTLDALHLASIYHLREQKVRLELVTYDERMARAAKMLEIPLRRLE